ncbi:MAG: hypothetical protein ABEH64_11890 [Salinirussus sp.]
MPDVAIIPTMDCEPPDPAISAHASSKSGTGPPDWEFGKAAIRGFAERCAEADLSPTLFIHPQVGDRYRDLFLELQSEGACLALHLHPYKFDETYTEDLGAYPEPEQRDLLEAAIAEWEAIFGEHPRLIRGGVYSANDVTMPILEDLGFTGGSLSTPGRVKPSAAAVWAGAPLDPHRGHAGFRLLAGDLDFVEVPLTVDPTRSAQSGHLGQGGYESLYVSDVEAEALVPDPEPYDLAAVTRNVLDRIAREEPAVPTLVTNTHNNMDYANPDHRAVANLQTVIQTATARCDDLDLNLVSDTVAGVVAAVD